MIANTKRMIYLNFHMPWDRSDSTFHYPIEELYKEPFGYIEGRGIEEKENYSPLLSELMLESASLCPMEHFVFFPRFPFTCDLSIKRWRIEVVEAQVGDSVSLIRRRADRGCIHCNLWFYIIERYFLSNNVYLNEHLIHGWFQMLICYLLYILE